MEKASYPKKLYRYMWLDYYYLQSIELIFSKNTIYSPQIASLNDPFDCVQQLEIKEMDDLKIINDIEAYRKKNGKEMSSSQKCHLMLVGPRKWLLYKYYYDFLAKMKKNRVLSLSCNLLEHSMWDAYANQYKGFCLELEPDDSWQDVLFEVDYVNERKKFDPLDVLKDKKIIMQMVNTKDVSWKHEGEWRIFNHQRRGIDYIPLPLRGIKTLYCGIDMPTQDIKLIEYWINKYQLKIELKKQKFFKGLMYFQ